jgi:hypothetical protein
MSAISSQTLILGLALVLTVVGLAGLAPSFMNVFRRRRLLAQLADLKVDEDAAQSLFSPALGLPHFESAEEPQEEFGAEEAVDSPAVMSAVVGAPAPMVRAAPARGHATGAAASHGVASSPHAAAPAADYQQGTGPLAAAGDEELVAEVDGEEPAAEAGQVDEEAEGDQDDLLAMFKDTQVHSSAPAVLTENLESVTAVDLLAQALELRDMLRKAA